MRSAQDYLTESASGHERGGFNRRMHGDSFSKATRGDRGAIYNDVSKGWSVADKMIKEGKMYSQLPGSRVWFKCYKDGNAFCCVGEGFVNLQESDNYAFSSNFDDAVELFMGMVR